VPAAVYCLVLYHGVRRWPLPTDLSDSYGLPKALISLGLLSFIYRLIDLVRIADGDLPGHPSLRAALMVLKYALYDEDPRTTLDLLIEAAAGFGLTTLIVVVRYLMKGSEWIDIEDIRARVARLMPGEEDKVISPALKQVIDEARPKIIDEARSKIIDEVRPGFVDQGRAALLLRQLTRKFGDLPEEVVGRVRAASTGELEQMADNVLTAATLEEVFLLSRAL